ncbi:MAG: hypothetical protein J5676_12815 [Bacteroidaceae bacterium]|nr:hypothetical protein [Bacteroidaceae bacterium]
MKKNLLFVAALFAASVVNAQSIFVVDGKTLLGADAASTAVSKSAGFEIGKIDGAVTCTTAFDDSYKIVGTNAKNAADEVINTITLGSATATVDTDGANGVQGQTNPKDAEGNPLGAISALPASGAVFKFQVEKDGFLYVFGKLSSNKTYMAWEEGKNAIGYTLYADWAKDVKGKTYTLEGDEEMNFLAGAGYTQILWPETILQATADGKSFKNADSDVTANENPYTKVGTSGFGYVKCAVYKDCFYYVHAVGSKFSLGAFGFSETNIDPVLSAGDATGVAAPVAASVSAPVKSIENGKVVISANGVKYNVAGVRVK